MMGMMMLMMVVMMMTRQCTRMSQVPNIVRRLADADNLPCRIGNYAHNDNHDGGDGDRLMVMVMVVILQFCIKTNKYWSLPKVFH